MPKRILQLLMMAMLVLAGRAQALSANEAKAMALGESDARVAALQKAVVNADERTVRFIQALSDDAVKLVGDVPVMMVDGKGVDPVTQAEVTVPDTAEDVMNNNRMRGELDTALAAVKLLSPDASVRRAAIKTLGGQVDTEKLPLLEKALASETAPDLKEQLQLLRAAALLGSQDPAQRLEAAAQLGNSAQAATKTLLVERLQVESDAGVKAALQKSLGAVEARLAWGDRLGAMFSGISLGSILLLVALGLAITYGLMGVINMAHGELMMIGAYTTWGVQNLFRHFAPGLFDAYVLLAIPASFLVSAAVGAVLERGVIRFLYGRPLETLLATWGISLVLMQGVRSLFGAQNVEVENPSWMSGGIAVASNLTLPYNRLAIIAFAALVLLATWALIARTRLGLFVRGVTQNRRMASCTGINTTRIDTLAFALGAGIAGMAGCALSQVGNVGPDLGQSYIVDSFMVVVLGGVGQLAGTVLAALGLGLMNKVLEGVAGAVLAKIFVLVFIVVFIQKRPQGLFALKGRSAES